LAAGHFMTGAGVWCYCTIIITAMTLPAKDCSCTCHVQHGLPSTSPTLFTVIRR
jgi:hypothetical protein